MSGLAEKIELLHDQLAGVGIPHAFGGALALAYCINEPRATRDIDVNVFVPPSQARTVMSALPPGAVITDQKVIEAEENGQVRIEWGETPIDLFFSYDDFHDQAAERARVVPFGDIEIPVLDCGDLVVFKAIFGRPRDWVDIDNVVASGGVDLWEPLERLRSILGPDHPNTRRLESAGSSNPDELEAYRRAFGWSRKQDPDL